MSILLSSEWETIESNFTTWEVLLFKNRFILLIHVSQILPCCFYMHDNTESGLCWCSKHMIKNFSLTFLWKWKMKDDVEKSNVPNIFDHSDQNPNSGGSRKSVRGWHFIQGGGDHGEKVVFKAHSRQYNPYFLGFV